ncbi:MAG: translational GTPase TypA [Verrucomicrobia bacterium]|nr:translational GTPase TypA [Verrucomicrobiota bacterium]MCH8512587.1 translational GTPase TypA [Kiritimatiellia bacterium]
MTSPAIRNIGIIAHVDHGKTTLVDGMLRQGGAFRANQAVAERAMDSMDLEREKGITIRSKNASVHWKDTVINIVDTPGHADFGGEVERILKMVDGVILLVDATDGPQAQTRFVLRKALEQNLHLIVVVNKVDRDTANAHRVHDLVLELLLELEATEEQFNCTFLYGSALNGYVIRDPDDKPGDLSPLFDTIVEKVPPPEVILDSPFRMLVSNLDWNSYVGRIAIGRIREGSIKLGQTIRRIPHDDAPVNGKAMKLYGFSGMGMVEVETASAGDIVGIAGFEDVYIGETICENDSQEALPFTAIDPPTLQMQFSVNDGPFAGKEGKFLTSRHLRDRLIRETYTNVSLAVQETGTGNTFLVQARGELQIAVLMETMRREGYEMLVASPEVIITLDEDGKKQEPFEDLWMDLPGEKLGDVMQALAARRGDITHMEHEHNSSRVLLQAVVPTRGLIGLDGYLTNLTSGEGVMSHSFKHYGPMAGSIPSRATGALVCSDQGTSTAYALDTIQERGRLFIGAGIEVYVGMVIGENSRPGDMPVNPCRLKQMTNVRASGTDKAIMLEPPVEMNLERALEFISDDEYVEATPKSIRIRKKILDPNMRKRARKAMDA